MADQKKEQKKIVEISPVQKAKLEAIIKDPVLWAKAFVIVQDPITKKYGPWIARDYQAECLRSRSLRKVYRFGRRLGKCIPGWVKILDPNTGELKTVESLFDQKNISVATMNMEYQISKQNNCNIQYNGIKPVYRVTLNNGKYIDATENHPLFTYNGWTEISQLKVGDYIATPDELPFFGDLEISEDIVKFTAYMIGDGNCTGHNIRFCQQDNAQLSEMREVCQRLGMDLRHYEYSHSPYDYYLVFKDQKRKQYETIPAKIILKELGLMGKGSDNKFIPDIFFQMTKKRIALFISRLFGTNGWATVTYKNNDRCSSRLEIGYSSNSRRLIYDLQHLLTRFGIASYVRQKTVKNWTLGIYSSSSIIKFVKEIGIYGKEEALSKVQDIAIKTTVSNKYLPPDFTKEINGKLKRQKIKKSHLIRAIGLDVTKYRIRNYKITTDIGKKIAQYLRLNDIDSLCNGNIQWCQIKDIQYLGDFRTYDLSVPNTHNFVANDIYVHNTEIMCIEALWRCFTNKNFRALFITPYDNQAALIFRRLREIINESPLIKAEIIKMKSSPHTVELKNGSIILGFTTGASSNQQAASVIYQ